MTLNYILDPYNDHPLIGFPALAAALAAAAVSVPSTARLYSRGRPLAGHYGTGTGQPVELVLCPVHRSLSVLVQRKGRHVKGDSDA